MYVRAKKSLGQHFLVDENIARKIVDSLDWETTRRLLEIGPGKGILTKYLFPRDVQLTVMDIDQEAIDFLTGLYPEQVPAILHGDFLKYRLDQLFDGPYNIIGNLPYNISSQILFRVLEERDRVEQMVCMLQKEVADRIRSAPGSKTYGILSVLLQAFYKIDYLFQVGPGVFHPPPKVRSAVIRLTRNSTLQLDCNEKLFFSLVKTGFNQRRKILRNSLKAMIAGRDLQDEMLSMRPEQLGVEQFVHLTNMLDQ